MDEADRMPCAPGFHRDGCRGRAWFSYWGDVRYQAKSTDNWLIVPNLWGGIVGDPSAKKTPAWGAALKPLGHLIAKAMNVHASSMADYETEEVVFDIGKEVLRDRITEAAKKKTDPAFIAKEVRSHGDQAPKEPTLRRYRTNDTTVEKLGELLRDNPAGLLVLLDELVGLIATWDREGREAERSFFLEAWNGDQSFDTDRMDAATSVSRICVLYLRWHPAR